MNVSRDIVNKILRSKNNHEKEYIVSVDKKISENLDFLKIRLKVHQKYTLLLEL